MMSEPSDVRSAPTARRQPMRRAILLYACLSLIAVACEREPTQPANDPSQERIPEPRQEPVSTPAPTADVAIEGMALSVGLDPVGRTLHVEADIRLGRR